MEMLGRRANHGKEDLRQRRSKQHLSEALLALMEERPFRDISVVDICDRAMVHRTTFYAHFEDKNALLQYVFDTLRDGFLLGADGRAADRTQNKMDYLMEVFGRVLKFLKEHRQVYLSGLEGGGPELRMMETAVAEDIFAQFGDGPSFDKAQARFYAGGVMSMLRWWLEDDMPVSEETLTESLRGILQGAKLNTRTE